MMKCKQGQGAFEVQHGSVVNMRPIDGQADKHPIIGKICEDYHIP